MKKSQPRHSRNEVMVDACFLLHHVIFNSLICASDVFFHAH